MSLLLILAMLFCVVPVVHADSVLPNTWYEFEFGTVGTLAFSGVGTADSSNPAVVKAPDSPWTINLGAFGTVVTVVDAFIQGDVFEMIDQGNIKGAKAPITNTGTNTGISDPDLALLNPILSRGFFALGPGAHSFDIEVLQNALGTTGGAAFFRVDQCPVPVPPSVFLFGTSLLGLVGWRLRRKNQA